MAEIVKLLGVEVLVGAGESTTANRATLVRIHNPGATVNVITPEDWEQLSDHIQYDYVYDNQFAELKESELLNERLGSLATIEPYIGKYYSQDWVRRKVLRQSDQEIQDMDKQIDKEIADGTIPDPSAIDPITGEPLAPGTEEDVMGMGDIPKEDDLEKAAATTDAQLAKDTKAAEI